MAYFSYLAPVWREEGLRTPRHKVVSLSDAQCLDSRQLIVGRAV